MITAESTIKQLDFYIEYFRKKAEIGHCFGFEYSPVTKNWYAWASYEPAEHLYRVPFISTDGKTMFDALEDLHEALEDVK